MIFTERVKSLIKERGITQDQFNKDVDISKNTLSYWEKEGRLPKPRKLQEIADYFSVSVEYLTGEEDRKASDARSTERFLDFLEEEGYSVEQKEDGTIEIGRGGRWMFYTEHDFRELCNQFQSQSGPELAMKSWARDMFPTREDLKRIFVTQPASMQHELPVYGDVSAGIGCNAEQHIIGWEVAGDEYDEDEYFYLLVEGDSMSPEIKNGDYVLVHSQDVIENGQIAVVVVDGEGLVKKIEMGEDHITLISINPYYPPRVFKEYDMNRVHIIGRVCEAKRKY